MSSTFSETVSPLQRLSARIAPLLPAAWLDRQWGAAVGEPHRRYLATRTFGSLDGVRAVCILGVIWHHVPNPGLPLRLAERGFLGVDMFFVLSGFLIVTLLLRERSRTGAVSLRKFYARRTLRIFPIYYLLIFGLLAVYLVFRPGAPNTRAYLLDLPFLLTYTANWVPIRAHNMGIVWSLATEEQFYLVWPAVEKWFRRGWVWVVLGGVLVVSQMINFGILDPFFAAMYGGTKPRLAILDATFTPIALGVLLAHLLHHPRGYAAAAGVVGGRSSWVGWTLILVALVEFWPGDLSGLPRLLIQVVMMVLLGSLVVREDHSARPILGWGPIRFVGMISYGLYLYHLWVIHPVRWAFLKLGWGLANPLFFATAVVACVAVAGLSYQFIERPILRWKERFAA